MLAERKPLKAVFFDLDDTLVLTQDADLQAYAAVAELTHQLLPQVDVDRLIDDWRIEFVSSPWDPTHQVDVHIWRTALWCKALQKQGVADQEVASQLYGCFHQTRMQLFTFEPGVHDLVTQLKSQGFSCAIITNGHASIQRAKLAACQAAGLFDAMLVGGEEVLGGREEKPDPHIFLKACAILDCHPSEAVHIGDSLSSDIQGGINAKLAATIWVNRDGRPLPATGPKPTFIVEHVTQLADVLQQLQREATESPMSRYHSCPL
ncbi:hypothetical protein WJX72_007201 [[Myrmecia] bisecta]|uniref:N-acylneuraminate-9-phosphatase n=1 Tax=[Myrmecia] bisecta TaxID=41462 RepID=A0AAW1Q124_9CHLO